MGSRLPTPVRTGHAQLTHPAPQSTSVARARRLDPRLCDPRTRELEPGFGVEVRPRTGSSGALTSPSQLLPPKLPYPPVHGVQSLFGQSDAEVLVVAVEREAQVGLLLANVKMTIRLQPV